MSPQEARQRLRSVNNLKQMVLAMHVWLSNEEAFPPADGARVAKMPLVEGLSWRAYLAPNLCDGPPYRDFLEKLKQFPSLNPGVPAEAWNRPVLLKNPVPVFKSPVPSKVKDPGLTYYRVFIGNGAPFEPGRRLKAADFPNGLSQTIFIVEAGEPVPWLKPDELTYDPHKPLPKLGGLFPDGFYAAFADGKVRFIPKNTDESLLRAMIARNSGKKVDRLPEEVNATALRKMAKSTFTKDEESEQFLLPPDAPEITVELSDLKVAIGDMSYHVSVKYRFLKGGPRADSRYQIKLRIPGYRNLGTLLVNPQGRGGLLELHGRDLKQEDTLVGEVQASQLVAKTMDVYMIEAKDDDAPFLKVSNLISYAVK